MANFIDWVALLLNGQMVTDLGFRMICVIVTMDLLLTMQMVPRFGIRMGSVID
jgi:hypothetical protein